MKWILPIDARVAEDLVDERRILPLRGEDAREAPLRLLCAGRVLGEDGGYRVDEGHVLDSLLLLELGCSSYAARALRTPDTNWPGCKTTTRS